MREDGNEVDGVCCDDRSHKTANDIAYRRESRCSKNEGKHSRHKVALVRQEVQGNKNKCTNKQKSKKSSRNMAPEGSDFRKCQHTISSWRQRLTLQVKALYAVFSSEREYVCGQAWLQIPSYSTFGSEKQREQEQ